MARKVSFRAVRHTQLDFGSVLNLDIVADFDGGDITSNGGGLLLKELDRKYGLTETAALCLSDERDSGKVGHAPLERVRQRVYQIALGYEESE